MSIEKINSNNTTTAKIELLNNMIVELSGMIDQAKFNKNEIDNLYTQLAESGFNLDREYLRNVLLGNTTSTYTNWSHLYAESGYSIWKLTPTNYEYSSLNNLYLDNKSLDNRGQATAESSITYDSVFSYDGDSGGGYTDNTTEAGTEDGTEFSVLESTSDYLYIGDDAKFSGSKFEWQTRGSNYTLKVEYWNGTWTQLTANTNNLDDDTSNFASDGSITFDEPADWVTTTVNSVSRYWIRISSTTEPATEAKAYLIIPTSSVIGLLALSSTQIFNEEWAWCSYDSNIYVTIRNSGNSSYEGDYYITSTSSSTNLQNFFVYNHEFKSDYLDVTYSGT